MIYLTMRLRHFLGLFSLVMTASSPLLAARLNASPWSGQKLVKLEYSEKPLAFSQVINSVFDEGFFTLGNWFQMSFDNTEFNQSKLNGVQAVRTKFTRVHFRASNMAGFKCNQCLFMDSTFSSVLLDGSRFFAGTFRNTHFTNSDLSRVDFINVRFENCTVDRATARTVAVGLLKKWNIIIKEGP